MTKPSDISQSAWDAAEAVGESIYGRHERGWVCWPLVGNAQEKFARAIDAARADQQRVIDFVRLWAWRDNPKLTNTERLSAIKYHPAIKPRAIQEKDRG
jgi:hypothetical protein